VRTPRGTAVLELATEDSRAPNGEVVLERIGTAYRGGERWAVEFMTAICRSTVLEVQGEAEGVEEQVAELLRRFVSGEL
jgi:hypothetical protein